ncbi:MAG: thioredoxin fold domain-containing protein [Oscillospiraceae bacterium]|nr:thioredoxin fold domain-containing protein [Oscillospiraceae bacterium]
MPIAVKAKNFETEVLQAKLPVLVDFWGPRCLPCRMLHPILTALAEECAGQIKFCMCNTDREPTESDGEFEEKFKLILSYNVMNLPTMLLFRDGKPLRTLIGLHTREELLEIFAEEGLLRQTHKEDAEDGKGGGANQ